MHWWALWARRISNSFLGLWQAWKERKESAFGITRKGNSLSQSRGEKFKTCWKNRKFSHPTNLFSSHHHFPPNHSPQVRVIPDSCLLAGSSQSLGPDRCCPFHKLSESLVSVPRGYCRYFWTWLLGLSLPSPLSNTFFQHAVREIFPKANSANSILSILSFKSFRSSKSCAQ